MGSIRHRRAGVKYFFLSPHSFFSVRATFWYCKPFLEGPTWPIPTPAPLCEAGRRDAQALTVTGRRRAHTGSIRRAVKRSRARRKPSRPRRRTAHGCATTRPLPAPPQATPQPRCAMRIRCVHPAHRPCCTSAVRGCCALRQRAHAQGCAGISRGLSGCAAARDGRACAARTGAAGGDSLRAGRHLCTRRSCRARASHRCVRSARPRGQRSPSGAIAWGASSRAIRRASTRDGRSHTHPLPADRGAACAAHGPDGDRHRRGRAHARAKRRGARRHVGWFLLREVLGAPEKRRDGAWYIAAVIVGTLALSLLLGFATGSVSGAVLLLIPVSEAVKRAAGRGASARDEAALRAAAGAAARHPAGGQDPVRDRGAAHLPRRCAHARRASGGIRAVQPRRGRAAPVRAAGRSAGGGHGARAHRPRHPARGARGRSRRSTHAMAGGFTSSRASGCRPPTGNGARGSASAARCSGSRSFCAGEADAMHCAAGDAAALRGTAYLLTLDADTRLTPGAARALAGAMLHPLNRPVVDAQRGVVTHGYGLLHPRMATELESANATDWARVFAGPGGSDPYGGVCGELYMDCFDRGGFSGKGILDVRALLACCGGDALPEQRILSHDALRGRLPARRLSRRRGAHGHLPRRAACMGRAGAPVDPRRLAKRAVDLLPGAHGRCTRSTGSGWRTACGARSSPRRRGQPSSSAACCAGRGCGWRHMPRCWRWRRGSSLRSVIRSCTRRTRACAITAAFCRGSPPPWCRRCCG